jgi:hypothetical protein
MEEKELTPKERDALASFFDKLDSLKASGPAYPDGSFASKLAYIDALAVQVLADPGVAYAHRSAAVCRALIAKMSAATGPERDALVLKLGSQYFSMNMRIGPEWLAMLEREDRLATLSAGRKKAHPKVVLAAKKARDKRILEFSVERVRDGMEIADILERLVAKFSKTGKDNQYPLQRGRLRVFITDARRVVRAQKKRAQQPK